MTEHALAKILFPGYEEEGIAIVKNMGILSEVGLCPWGDDCKLKTYNAICIKIIVILYMQASCEIVTFVGPIFLWCAVKRKKSFSMTSELEQERRPALKEIATILQFSR